MNRDPSPPKGSTVGSAPGTAVSGASTYKSILGMNTSQKSSVVGLNPNLKPSTTASYTKIFPMYGLWREDNIFKSTKQVMSVTQEHIEEYNVEKDHFKKMYKEKEYMEEMLKSKNMMGNKKKDVK